MVADVDLERLQLLEELGPAGLGERGRDPDVLELSVGVQPEEQ